MSSFESRKMDWTPTRVDTKMANATASSNTTQLSHPSLEGTSTLSFLTALCEKEDSRQKRTNMPRDSVRKNGAIPRTMLSSQTTTMALQPQKPRNQDGDARYDILESVPFQRKSLPLKKRPFACGTSADKENIRTCTAFVRADDTECGKSDLSKNDIAAKKCRQELVDPITNMQKQPSKKERLDACRDVRSSSVKPELKVAPDARRLSATLSSLRYLDPAVLSALTKHALEFGGPASKKFFFFGSSSIWRAGAASTSWPELSAPKVTSDRTKKTVTHPVPSSTDVKETLSETSNTLSGMLDSKEPADLLTCASSQGTRHSSIASLKQPSSSTFVQSSELFHKPPQEKWKRLKSIEESKESCLPIEYQKSKTKKRSSSLEIDETVPKQVNDDTWMSDDVQGLVETKELEPIKNVPRGLDPWEYLWESGAPPFELEIVSCAQRRNVAWLGTYSAI